MRLPARVGVAFGAMLLMALSPFTPRPIDLPGERVFPESLSIDADGYAYVSSLSGGVLRVKLHSSKVEQFIAPGGSGTSSTFGVFAHDASQTLWVCSLDLGFAGISIPGADKGATLKGFDLRTGAGKTSLALPGTGGFCNDIAVGKDGSVYATDTNSSHIYRWREGQAALEDWFSDPALVAPQGGGLDGIAVDALGHLIVNNFKSGQMARIEIGADGKPGKVQLLATSEQLLMPDGLRVVDGNRFVQAEGGGTIALVTVAGEGARIDKLVTGLRSATGVDVHDGTVWYVQGHVEHVFDPARRAVSPPLPFQIRPVALPRP